MLKIRTDNKEGFYKMGRPDGKWTDYYVGTNTIMRTYHITNGAESIGIRTASIPRIQRS